MAVSRAPGRLSGNNSGVDLVLKDVGQQHIAQRHAAATRSNVSRDRDHQISETHENEDGFSAHETLPEMPGHMN